MNFTEYDFLVFFIIVFAAYWLARRRAWQNLILLAASYLFYGWIHPWYAILLGLSTLADYFLALRIASDRPRSGRPLALSLLLNVGVLAFFKYFGFFSEEAASLSLRLGLRPDLISQIVLPVGLSFYTLKKLAYVIDIYRGTLEPSRDLASFALFVSFFPQINSGPIDRFQTLMPQIQSDRPWRSEHFTEAWPLIVMGFFKKTVVAGMISEAVDRIFGLQQPTLLLLSIGGAAYAVQVLADFSAYTDLARGIARLFGFETSINFRAPLLAISPADFWNRWHITLSTWLRDYIFFPVRRSLLRASRPVWLVDAVPPIMTMLVSGVWHGAGWNYLLWGGGYGLLIAAYQMLGFGGNWKPANGFTRAFAWVVMFAFTSLLFLILRSPSLTWLATALASASLTGSSEEGIAALASLSIVLCFGAPLLIKHLLDQRFHPESNLHALYYVAATATMFMYLNSAAPDFIYFRF